MDCSEIITHETDMLEFYEIVIISWNSTETENPKFEMLLVHEALLERFLEVNENTITSIRFFAPVPVVCAECGAVMEFDAGQRQTFEEPGEPAAMVCTGCDSYSLDIPKVYSDYYFGSD